jgi:hypothetical protein
MNHSDLKAKILQQAAKDPAFREALKANPRQALSSLSIPIPADLELSVVEESPTHLYLVLPVESSELSEDELLDVTGGIRNRPPNREREAGGPKEWF